MTTPTALEAKDAIRDVLHSYCFRLDAGEFDSWAELFTTDAVFVPSPDQECHGRAAIRDYIGSVLSEAGAGPGRKHLTINAVITLAGDEADVISNVLVVLETAAGITIALAGRYADHIVNDNGHWRFKKRAVHFDIVGDLGLNS